MKTQDIDILEGYINTPNKPINDYNFMIICKLIGLDLFKNPSIPIKLINDSINSLINFHDQPINAIQIVTSSVNEKNLSLEQKHFIYNHLFLFFKNHRFPEKDLSRTTSLLRDLKDKNQKELSLNTRTSQDIRACIKEIIFKELQNIQNILDSLEPKDRLILLYKLLPLIMPKIESIHHLDAEVKSIDF